METPSTFDYLIYFYQVAIVSIQIDKDNMMLKDNMQEYLESNSNMFLHLDDPEWLKELNKGVGESIKMMRRFKKLSRAKCAELAGIPVKQLKRYEMGEEQLNIFHLWNLAEVSEDFMSEILYGLTPYFRNIKYDEDEE